MAQDKQDINIYELTELLEDHVSTFILHQIHINGGSIDVEKLDGHLNGAGAWIPFARLYFKKLLYEACGIVYLTPLGKQTARFFEKLVRK